MNISVSAIIASLLFSTIGFWLLKEAKKQGNLKLIPIGITLFAYTYFTPNAIYDWVIGIALCGLAYSVIKYN